MQHASLAQLERSHRRHDEVMAGLLEAARRLAAGRAEDADFAAIHGAVEFFTRAVTRHFLDEEGSVFPRLSTRRPDLAEALAALSAEHPPQIALQFAVAAAASALGGDTRPGAAMTLLDAATRLAEAHRAHVEHEDALFAQAQAALTAEDDAEIVAEMETRRDRDGGRGRGGGGGGGGGGGRRRREAQEAHAAEPVQLAMDLPAPPPPPAAKGKAAPAKAKPAAPKAKPALAKAKKAKPAPAKAPKAKPPTAKAAPAKAKAKAKPATTKAKPKTASKGKPAKAPAKAKKAKPKRR